VSGLYCYSIDPIDHWCGSMSAEEAVSEFSADRYYGEKPCLGGMHGLLETAKWLTDLEAEAEIGFKSIGWEGDNQDGSRFFALPQPDSFAVGIVIKQSNNGTTFVASPHPLPWIKPHDECFAPTSGMTA